MKKVFVDTNFLMDLFGRKPNPETGRNQYEEDAIEVINQGKLRKIMFYASFLSVANFAYLLRKTEPQLLFKQIETICELFIVLPNEEKHLRNAIKLRPADYEDAVQYATAISAGCDCIITRNGRDFPFATIPVLSPQEFLQQL